MLILKPVFEIIKMKREHNAKGHGAEHGQPLISDEDNDHEKM